MKDTTTDIFDPSMSRPLEIGGWNTLISDQAVTLLSWQIQKLEAVLNEKYLPAVRQLFRAQHPEGNHWLNQCDAPAPIVRFDMAPMTDNPSDHLGIWEIEANTAGLGIAHMLDVPAASWIDVALKEAGVRAIGYAVSESRSNQAGDLQVLMDALSAYAMNVRSINLSSGVPQDLPLWLRAGAEDLSSTGPVLSRLPQCLMWHPDGGGSKQYLFDIDPTVTRVSDIVNLEGVPERFDTGVVLKPINGWGARDITIYPRQQPWKKRGDSAARLIKILKAHRAAGVDDQYMLQSFVPPSCVGEGFLAWRVLAIYRPKKKRYQVIGGLWNWRPKSIRLHGTPETVNGPIFVEK